MLYEINDDDDVCMYAYISGGVSERRVLQFDLKMSNHSIYENYSVQQAMQHYIVVTYMHVRTPTFDTFITIFSGVVSWKRAIEIECHKR